MEPPRQGKSLRNAMMIQACLEECIDTGKKSKIFFASSRRNLLVTIEPATATGKKYYG